MLQALVMILIVLVRQTGNDQIAADVWEWQSLPTTHHYYGENYDFEDGSYVHSNEYGTVAGCIPFELCSWVNMDTPWEDILNVEDAEVMYKLVRFYKTYRDAMSIFH